MNKRGQLMCLLASLGLFFGHSQLTLASVTVPQDVRVLADSLHNEENDNLAREKAIEETKKNIAGLESNLAQLQSPESAAHDAQAINDLATAKESWSKAVLELDKCLTERVKLEYAWQLVQEALTARRAEFEDLEERLSVEPEGDAADQLYLQQIEVEEQINNLEYQDDLVYGHLQECDDNIAQIQEDISFYEKLNENLDQGAATALSPDDRRKNISILNTELAAEKNNLFEYENFSVKNRQSQSVSLGTKYYSWTDNKGNNGYQYFLPFSYNMVNGAFDYSIETGLAISNNVDVPDGSLQTMTDTMVTAAYTQPLPRRDMLIYTLGLNLPTGKAALSGNYPVMSDDLVEKSRFGEGLNIIPEIWWHHNIDKHNTLILGTYYTFAGRYDLDSNMSDSWLEPGNSWVKTLQWKYLASKLQCLAELSHTSYGVSHEADQQYQSGDMLAPSITLNYAPDQGQFFTFYWWNGNEQPLYNSTLVQLDDVRIGNNIGLQWAGFCHAAGRMRLYVDYLSYHGEYYDPLTNLTTNYRRKITYGIGYDYFLNQTDVISLDLEGMTMRDAGLDDADNNYHGCNVFLKYQKSM